MISPMDIKYANENANMIDDSIDKLFAVDDTKFVILSSATGSMMPETSINPSLHKTIFKTGDIMVKISKIRPE